MEADALKRCALFSRLHFRVALILSLHTQPQVASRVVVGVTVDMIHFHAVRCIQDFPVQSHSVRLFIALSSTVNPPFVRCSTLMSFMVLMSCCGSIMSRTTAPSNQSRNLLAKGKLIKVLRCVSIRAWGTPRRISQAAWFT